jgi:hypothetical protein
MPESIQEQYGRWRLGDLLLQHPGLGIVPSSDNGLVLAGELNFILRGPAHAPIEDTYAVEMQVPSSFPRRLPGVKETGGRIPEDFHKLEGNLLCLAAPTELRLRLTASPTLPTFVNRFVIPYLFGYSYFARHGVMPFGELDHGARGIRQHLAELFSAPSSTGVERFMLLASLKKRVANKRACPCGSGRRLGRCHNRSVNRVRARFGPAWCRDEYARITRRLGNMNSPTTSSRMSETATEAQRKRRPALTRFL